MSKKVLIIDDEEDIRDYVESLLSNNGYETKTADDGVKAFDILKQYNPDLVVLDIIMPNQSGVGFYRNIRKSDDHKDTPVIILSGANKYKDFFSTDHKSLPQPQDFIEKPFAEDDLLEKVKTYIK